MKEVAHKELLLLTEEPDRNFAHAAVRCRTATPGSKERAEAFTLSCTLAVSQLHGNTLVSLAKSPGELVQAKTVWEELTTIELEHAAQLDTPEASLGVAKLSPCGELKKRSLRQAFEQCRDLEDYAPVWVACRQAGYEALAASIYQVWRDIAGDILEAIAASRQFDQAIRVRNLVHSDMPEYQTARKLCAELDIDR